MDDSANNWTTAGWQARLVVKRLRGKLSSKTPKTAGDPSPAQDQTTARGARENVRELSRPAPKARRDVGLRHAVGMRS